MIEINRERSDEKIAAAKLAIQKLLDWVLFEYFLKKPADAEQKLFRLVLLIK